MDHPRSRGVYMNPTDRPTHSSGSSPLARGLLDFPVGEQAPPGIIPARAGFTQGRQPRQGRCRDHPRSRGVYSASSVRSSSRYGSSPLARGLPRPSGQGSRSGRIIPARAGFTEDVLTEITIGQDHPRSRGVYLRSSDAQKRIMGSSPLARGLLLDRSVEGDVTRIIPARAGFTRGEHLRRRRRRDHPRSRGVYFHGLDFEIIEEGSSPLARGLLPRSSQQGPLAGIIPARAGFTGPSSPTTKREEDHPRSRGVYDPAGPIREVLRGSSPLARGLHQHPAADRGGRRIIPARAGFTDGVELDTDLLGDHPRSRGVYRGEAGHQRRDQGSSPLARGLQRGGEDGELGGGIIPARAGFTR